MERGAAFAQGTALPARPRAWSPLSTPRRPLTAARPARAWRVGMAVSKQQGAAARRRGLRLPWLRVSATRLSRAARLRRVSRAVALSHAPILAALLGRAAVALRAAPLPLAERVILAALVLIAPALRGAACANIDACALVSQRRAKRDIHDLPVAVRAHQVLTMVVAAGTLSGLCTALCRPASGALVVLLFQAIFYLARRVRFERGGKVFRCHPQQYRDIVWACAAAAACVGAVLRGFYPLPFACGALGVSVLFWVCYFVFVPVSAGL